MTLVYLGAAVTRNVIYVPEDNTAPEPAPPLIQQDISSKYYYVYNYSHFIEMVNATLRTALEDLRKLVTPVVFDQPKPTLQPYLDFDIITNRVILHAEQIRYDETCLTTSRRPGYQYILQRATVRPVCRHATHLRIKPRRCKLPLESRV
ncbi:MAG: phage minor capsid protein, partial [Candidatus Fonsibacter sp.]